MKNNGLQNKKILIVAPAFLEWDLGSYLRSILQEKKFNCDTFGYQQFTTRREAGWHLLSKVKHYKPDIILGLKLDQIEAHLVKELKKEGVFTALWYVDCISDEVPDWITPLFKEVDVFFTTAKGMVPKYKDIGDTPAYWLYEGAHLPVFPLLPRDRYKPQKLYRSEVAFVGSIYYWDGNGNICLRREDFLKKINKDRLKVWGPQGVRRAKEIWGKDYPAIEWPAYNEELVKVCRGADVVVGINTTNSVELYFSNRTFITLAAGGFHITEYVPGLETMFKNHGHLVWFHSDEECLDLIGYYLKRPRQRKKIAREGQRWVRKKYSMRRQVNKLLAIIAKHYAKA
jgi:spore maturation protein CgeB